MSVLYTGMTTLNLGSNLNLEIASFIITGRNEPWHVRYVGDAAARFMTEHNLCLEEFVALYQ